MKAIVDMVEVKNHLKCNDMDAKIPGTAITVQWAEPATSETKGEKLKFPWQLGDKYVMAGQHVDLRDLWNKNAPTKKMKRLRNDWIEP